MTENTRQDVRAVIVAVLSSALVGMGSAYLTANATLATVQADQKHLSSELDALKAEQKALRKAQTDTDKALGEATIELRVLNERLKRVDDIGEAVKRVERKVDSALVRRTER